MLLWKKCLILVISLVLFDSALAKSKATQFTTEEGFVEVEGGRIWYQIVSTEKTKNAIPLVMLHGGPGVPHGYLNVFKTLAKQRPIIFYDQLGCGQSSIARNDNSLWTLARFERELETLVNHLHLKKFHLFGHSWGGALASEYALQHPDRLQSLTLASPLLSTDLWRKDARQLISQLAPEVQNAILTNEDQGTTDSEVYVKATDVYAHHFVCRMHEWPSALSLAELNQNVYQTMWGPSEFTMRGNLRDFDQIPKLKTLHMPVLITGGRYDEARPETLAYAASQMPQARLITYKHSAHVAFLEETQRYIRDLRRFIKAADVTKLCMYDSCIEQNLSRVS